jgi:hypothetical protein
MDFLIGVCLLALSILLKKVANRKAGKLAPPGLIILPLRRLPASHPTAAKRADCGSRDRTGPAYRSA